jgi:uncharacterized membrane protein YdbT with pleckstrin-like domain
LSTKSEDELYVWSSKPYVLPKVLLSLISVTIVAFLAVWVEFYFGVASISFLGLNVYVWTVILFVVAAFASVLHPVVLYVANSYMLSSDGLEVKRGLVTLHLFVVTSGGFSDLEVYQSVWGRLFGYGDVLVRSQGDKVVRLVLIASPFVAAEQIRKVLGKPKVRFDTAGV